MASGITMDPECKEVYDAVKGTKALTQDGIPVQEKYGQPKYALFKISDTADGLKSVVVDYMADKSTTETYDDEKQAWQEFVNKLQSIKKEARYCLYDFRHHPDDAKSQIATVTYIFWCPDDGVTVKEKMVYAATNNVVKGTFTGLKKYNEAHDMSDLDMDDIISVSIKKVT